MKNRKKSEQNGVFAAIRMAAGAHPVLTAGTLLCVAGSVGASLVPPLLLARIIDRLTAGIPLTVQAVLLYFGSLTLEGGLSSAQESLLVLFGQKMTHALRTEMSRKLTRLPAGMLVRQNPGEVAARFSGDVDTVEALFTSGIISMAADACRIVSILAVIAVKNTGLALILLLVLPLFALFTRHVQKRMLAAQLDNRRAVAAVSGQVPETLHNIRTIRALGLEAYREQRYDRCIGDSYAAMERTNFYDAIYSPVVLVLNAVVVGAVMLLSASGNAAVLTLFGMSVGTSVAVINYISRIFEPIESLGMEIQTIQSAMAGVKRIDAFLAQPEREQPPARATAARGDVVLDHVTFGYGEKHVLEDFSMTVKQGEHLHLSERNLPGSILRCGIGRRNQGQHHTHCQQQRKGLASTFSHLWTFFLIGLVTLAGLQFMHQLFPFTANRQLPLRVYQVTCRNANPFFIFYCSRRIPVMQRHQTSVKQKPLSLPTSA